MHVASFFLASWTRVGLMTGWVEEYQMILSDLFCLLHRWLVFSIIDRLGEEG